MLLPFEAVTHELHVLCRKLEILTWFLEGGVLVPCRQVAGIGEDSLPSFSDSWIAEVDCTCTVHPLALHRAAELYSP